MGNRISLTKIDPADLPDRSHCIPVHKAAPE